MHLQIFKTTYSCWSLYPPALLQVILVAVLESHYGPILLEVILASKPVLPHTLSSHVGLLPK